MQPYTPTAASESQTPLLTAGQWFPSSECFSSQAHHKEAKCQWLQIAWDAANTDGHSNTTQNQEEKMPEKTLL